MVGGRLAAVRAAAAWRHGVAARLSPGLPDGRSPRGGVGRGADADYFTPSDRAHGVALFTDAGTVYGADERLADTRWDRSVGAGFFINAPVVSMRLDVAHGLDAGTRAHFTLGLAF